MFNPEWQQRTIHSVAWMMKHRIKVFPCAPASKSPANKDSWPAIASNNVNDIPRLFPGNRNHNVGIVLNQESGVLDLEPDDPEAVELVERLIAVTGVRTMAYRSRKGTHRIFQWNARLAEVIWHDGRPRVGGLECRNAPIGGNLYSVGPFSLHENREVWIDWLPGCAPWEIGPQPLPQNIVDHILTYGKRKGDGKLIPATKSGDGYLPAPGFRHESNLAFSHLMRCGLFLPEDTTIELLRVYSQHSGSYEEPGRGEVELVNCVKNLKPPIQPEDEIDIDWDQARELAVDNFLQVKSSQFRYKKDLPDNIFPKVLQDMSVHAEKAQVPRNMFLMTSLGVIAAAVGSAVRIRVSGEHNPLPPSIYCMAVGDSGSGKSKTLNPLTDPLEGTGRICTDATPEALQKALCQYPRGILMPLAEGKKLAGMFTRYGDGNSGSSSSILHECWSCDAIRVFRKSGNLEIPRPHLSIIAGIQPIHFSKFPPDELMDGLLPRMLVLPIGNVPDEEDLESVKILKQFQPVWRKAVQRLMGLKIAMGVPSLMALMEAAHQVIEPLDMILSPEAYALYRKYNKSKRSPALKGQWEEGHPYRSDVLRHAEYAVRISGCFELGDLCLDGDRWDAADLNSKTWYWISADSFERAVALVENCWKHKQFLCDDMVDTAFGRLTNNHGLEKLQSIPEKLEKFAAGRATRLVRHQMDAWSLRDYYRIVGIEKNKAQAELDLLISNGYVLPIPGEDRIKRFQFKELT